MLITLPTLRLRTSSSLLSPNPLIASVRSIHLTLSFFAHQFHSQSLKASHAWALIAERYSFFIAIWLIKNSWNGGLEHKMGDLVIQRSNGTRSISQSLGELDQVAHSSDGAPKVMCKRCGAILEHPQSLSSGTTARQGTSTMGKHLKGTGCTKAARHRTQKSGITQFINATVTLYPLIFSTILISLLLRTRIL